MAQVPKKLKWFKMGFKKNVLIVSPKRKKMRQEKIKAVENEEIGLKRKRVRQEKIIELEDKEVDVKRKKNSREKIKEVKDKTINEEKQVTDEESEKEHERERNEMDKESEETIQIKDEEFEEEKNESEEEEEKGEKNESVEELKQENIKHERRIGQCNGKPYLTPKNDDNDDDDVDDDSDCTEDIELKYDSDGSIIDDDNLISLAPKPLLTPEEELLLSKLIIKLKHEVAPQHKVEQTAGTRVLTKEEREEFEKYATLRMGTFLKSEDKILRKNWRDFCRMHKWNANNPKPFLQMRHKNKVAFFKIKQRRKFIQFLANGLNERSLYSIFNRFKVLFDPHKVKRYSEREDSIILEFIRRYKISDRERDRKFAELSSILRRTRASVWRRYRVLKKKHNIPDIT